jgi:hypothetical protein
MSAGLKKGDISVNERRSTICPKQAPIAETTPTTPELTAPKQESIRLLSVHVVWRLGPMLLKCDDFLETTFNKHKMKHAQEVVSRPDQA